MRTGRFLVAGALCAIALPLSAASAASRDVRTRTVAFGGDGPVVLAQSGGSDALAGEQPLNTSVEAEARTHFDDESGAAGEATPIEGPALTVSMDEDPHALIPADPDVSLVAVENGIVVERRSSTVAVAPAPSASAGATTSAPLVVSPPPAAGAQASGTAQAPPATASTPSQTTVIINEGEEQRAAYPRARVPEDMRSTYYRERTDDDFHNTFTVQPRGFLNVDDDFDLDDRSLRSGSFALQYDRVLSRPLSLVLGFDFAPEDRSGAFRNGDAVFGADLGLNLFLAGGHNEGLYIGPRGYLGISGVDDDNDSASGRLGFGGEIGFRFIADSGMTAGLGVGLQNRRIGLVADTPGPGGIQTREFDRQNLLYGALQVGWSW